MQIEIRDESRRCEACGAGAPIFLPSCNKNLEIELLAAMVKPRWWQPVRRLGDRHARRAFVKLADELRQETIHA